MTRLSLLSSRPRESSATGRRQRSLSSVVSCHLFATVLMASLSCDGGGLSTAQTCISASPAPTPSQSATDASLDCEKGAGSDCKSTEFISKQAAECIAEADGLAEGMSSWKLQIFYDKRYTTVVWTVDNTTEDLGPDGISGDSVKIHATTGRVLDRGGWTLVP